MSFPALTVCVVTSERPAYLKRCLEAIEMLDDPVDEVVLVDASAEDHASSAREACPSVVYVWAPHRAGWITRSRNEALRRVKGDVIAFIDDDVCVHRGWSEALRQAYSNPILSGAGGRTLNGLRGEEGNDEPVGRYFPDGALTGNFAARQAAPIEIDHGIGANMSFRRSVLADLGGFRDDYPGTALREDTDVFLRIKSMGGGRSSSSLTPPSTICLHRTSSASASTPDTSSTPVATMPSCWLGTKGSAHPWCGGGCETSSLG